MSSDPFLISERNFSIILFDIYYSKINFTLFIQEGWTFSVNNKRKNQVQIKTLYQEKSRHVFFLCHVYIHYIHISLDFHGKELIVFLYHAICTTRIISYRLCWFKRNICLC